MQWTVKKLCSCGFKVKKGSDYASVESFGRSVFGFSPIWVRTFNLLSAIIVISWSCTTFWGPIWLWLIYMTHWGLVMILLESAFGIAVAVIGLPQCQDDGKISLPWYVKTYWLLYNVSIPLAFLITVFYWSLLYPGDDGNPLVSPAMDVALHAANSILMSLELFSASHPSRLAHCYQPICFGLLYVLFGLVYYFVGGLDPFGNVWVYPVIDWSKPGPSSVVVVVTALLLLLMHLVVVALAAARDALAIYCRKKHAFKPEDNKSGA